MLKGKLIMGREREGERERVMDLINRKRRSVVFPLVFVVDFCFCLFSTFSPCKEREGTGGGGGGGGGEERKRKRERETNKPTTKKQQYYNGHRGIQCPSNETHVSMGATVQPPGSWSHG